jgi:dipeptidyl aminopeptidase/acylaminoacyl peptidase
MRHLVFSIILIHLNIVLWSQKKTMDIQTISEWPTAKCYGISNDGSYAAFGIDSGLHKGMLVIQATRRPWKRNLLGYRDVTFTEDSKHAIFFDGRDSLCILDLDKDSLWMILSVTSFKTPEEGDGSWLAYLQKGEGGKLRLLNLLTGKISIFPGVSGYFFNKSGEKLIIFSQNPANPQAASFSVVYIDLEKGNMDTISRSGPAGSLVFDPSGKGFAYLDNHSIKGSRAYVLRYYREGMDSAMKLVDSSTPGMSGMEILDDKGYFFSDRCDMIFFRIHKKVTPYHGDATNPDVSVQKSSPHYIERPLDRVYAEIMLNKPNKIVYIRPDNFFTRENLILSVGANENYALDVVYSKEGGRRKDGSAYLRRDIYLIKTSSGELRIIRKDWPNAYLAFSPLGKYVLWYDTEKGAWFTYQIDNGAIRNISRKIPRPSKSDRATGLYKGNDEATGWLEQDEKVLLYDQYDVWKVDPKGIVPPENVTHGYGRRNHIRFRPITFTKDKLPFLVSNQPSSISLGDTLLLSAFNLSTKENGLFSLTLGPNSRLKLLIMGPEVYHVFSRYSLTAIRGLADQFYPIKAKYTNAYIFQRMGPNKFPNFYYTTDCIHFDQMTKLEPNTNYKWYTTQFVRWKIREGRQGEGILYKPEDFDPRKKYPIIFFYYEKTADALNYFIHPAFANGAINIPWFVNHGYLVFVPDIEYYKAGYPGECAFESVQSSALYFARFPWVNKDRMGLQGHSYGGWETNYIVSRSGHLFAAAVSAAGYSDLISSFSDDSHYFESGQGRIGASLWDNPNLYIQNSPVFNASKVTTPLLIVHGKDDGAVSLQLAKEWFNDLQTANKSELWLLSYGGEGHTIGKTRNQMDLTNKLSEFFDYYLKGEGDPQWMNAR